MILTSDRMRICKSSSFQNLFSFDSELDVVSFFDRRFNENTMLVLSHFHQIHLPSVLAAERNEFQRTRERGSARGRRCARCWVKTRVQNHWRVGARFLWPVDTRVEFFTVIDDR